MSEYVLGEAIVDQELVFDENKYFALHVLNGTEPWDDTTFDLAARFLREKHGMKQSKDQLHAVWYVTLSGRFLLAPLFPGSV